MKSRLSLQGMNSCCRAETSSIKFVLSENCCGSNQDQGQTIPRVSIEGDNRLLFSDSAKAVSARSLPVTAPKRGGQI